MVGILFAALIVLLLIGAPVFIALSGSALLAFVLASDMPLLAVAQRLFGGLDKFSLLAIPFFILAANVMKTGGMAKRVLNLANVLVGGFNGGIALTAVVACMFFGAMAGSAPATVIAIGALLYPALMKSDYGQDFSSGLITASASAALLIPPSLTMIIYGSVTGASVGALFMAGFGAGLIYCVVFIIYSFIYSRKRKITLQPKASGREVFNAIIDNLWALGVPIIIIGGIYGGIFTPTEAAAVSAVYAILVGMLIYREMNFKELFYTALDSAKSTAQVMIMIAGASVLSWILTLGQVPQFFSSAILSLSDSPIIILLAMNIIMLIAGMFMDGSSFILILAPLFLPIAVQIGIDPVHLGIIMVANGAIGMFTPPFGLNLFVATGVCNLPYEKVVRGVWPFIALSLISLAIITYVPQISMWLPNLLYGR